MVAGIWFLQAKRIDQGFRVESNGMTLIVVVMVLGATPRVI